MKFLNFGSWLFSAQLCLALGNINFWNPENTAGSAYSGSAAMEEMYKRIMERLESRMQEKVMEKFNADMEEKLTKKTPTSNSGKVTILSSQRDESIPDSRAKASNGLQEARSYQQAEQPAVPSVSNAYPDAFTPSQKIAAFPEYGYGHGIPQENRLNLNQQNAFAQGEQKPARYPSQELYSVRPVPSAAQETNQVGQQSPTTAVNGSLPLQKLGAKLRAANQEDEVGYSPELKYTAPGIQQSGTAVKPTGSTVSREARTFDSPPEAQTKFRYF